MEVDKFVSIKQAKEIIGFSMHEIRQACKNGSIPCVRSGSGSNARYKMSVNSLQKWAQMRVALNTH